MSNSNKLGRVIGLDIGKKRIGSAITDELRLICKPHKVFEMRGSINAAVKEIITECEQLKVHTIVAGLPLELDGSKGKQTLFTEKVITSLVKLISDSEVLEEISIQTPILIPPYSIHLVDERFTSVQAEYSLSHLGLKDLERREEKDNVSASIILQTYLDSVKNNVRN